MNQCKLRLFYSLSVGLIFVVLILLQTETWQVSLYNSHVTPSSIKKATRKVYFITQTYGGQITRAMRNMMVQQCWAGLYGGIDAVITEPFSTESQLLHTALIWNDYKMGELHTATRFGNYYDLKYYNLQSKKHGFASIISWDDFLHTAPRAAVAVTIPSHSCTSSSADDACAHSKQFLTFLNGLTDLGFNVTKTVCLVCSKRTPYSLDDFTELMGNNSEMSVFFSNWRNYAFTKTWIEIPSYCRTAQSSNSSNFLSPSPSILNHTKHYLDNFVTHQHYIGIMLRIERFLTLVVSGRSNETVDSCLKKTISVLQNIQHSTKTLGTYITVDIGKYGSGVMQKEAVVSHLGKDSIQHITRLVESMFREVYNYTITLEEWENTFVNSTDGITERGYIAMLQQNLATQSDCLILMGGGSFQQVVGVQYLNKREGKSPCLHTVCASSSFQKLFNG